MGTATVFSEISTRLLSHSRGSSGFMKQFVYAYPLPRIDLRRSPWRQYCEQGPFFVKVFSPFRSRICQRYYGHR